MDQLIDALKKEAIYFPPEETVRRFLDLGERRYYPAKSYIIAPETLNDSLYLTMVGTIRVGWFDSQKENTFGFGSTGTFFLSPRSFMGREKAHYFLETCTECAMMAWSKATVMQVLEDEPLLAKWLFFLCISQFYGAEMKSYVIKGTAKNRYDTLVNGSGREQMKHMAKRPDILKLVSSKVLASYLGVSPSYLSNIRKESLKGGADKESQGISVKARKPRASNVAKAATANGAINGAKTTSANGANIGATKEERLATVLRYLSATPPLSFQAIAEVTGYGLRSIKRYSAELQASGAISRSGATRSGHWIVNAPKPESSGEM
ncbi:MAG: hypothetical protein LUD17_11435 [Bacteroidales bacterium]|nr:hypothetical protein [Bacteroidales bacterium]